jgi:hypothetical protein
MKETYYQNKVITIPVTGATPQLYQTIFKADDCYKYLSGIAAFCANSVPTADLFQIELRDDFNTVFSFSPFENWIKNTHAGAFNLQDTFKPLCIEAKGRNFYMNVKVKNLATPYTFTAVMKQTQKPVQCVRYDEQAFEVVAPALGQTFEITLPSDYQQCKGVMLTGGDVTNENLIGFDISDAYGQIVDPLPVSILKATANTQYDNGFFPVNFESKSRQIKVRLTQLGPLAAAYSANNYQVTFLLVDETK